MNLVTIDFETYYDQQYSLSKITTEEYIRSDMFEVIGVSPMDARRDNCVPASNRTTQQPAARSRYALPTAPRWTGKRC